MRILDELADKSLNAVTVYLTQQEAAELRDSLEQILADPVGRHEHVSSEDYRKELTVCIYEIDHLERFDDRSQRLILEDR